VVTANSAQEQQLEYRLHVCSLLLSFYAFAIAIAGQGKMTCSIVSAVAHASKLL
jgi:hypothetical protein